MGLAVYRHAEVAGTRLPFKRELGFWRIQLLKENACLSVPRMKNGFCQRWLGRAACRDLSLKAISSSPKISGPVGFSISVLLIRTRYGPFGYPDKEWEKNKLFFSCQQRNPFPCLWPSVLQWDLRPLQMRLECGWGRWMVPLEECRQGPRLQIKRRECLCSHR